MDPVEILKDINAAQFSTDQERELKQVLGAQDFTIVVFIVRTSWILSYDIPDEYRGGRCIQGHINSPNGPEVEIMFPHSRDAEVQQLKRNERLELNVRYNHFDKLFSRASFLDIGSNLCPVPEEFSEEPDSVHYYLANLLSIAFADGHLCESEKEELDKILDKLNARKKDFNIAYNLIANGEYDCRVVGSYAQQVQNLEDMMRVCLADGELHDYEQQWITHFSGMIGMDQNGLDQIYKHLDETF